MSEFLLEYSTSSYFTKYSHSFFFLALLLAPAVIAPKQPDTEKLSTYECGFNAFDDSRMKFDVRFLLWLLYSLSFLI